jgi:WD40 repeat protein
MVFFLSFFLLSFSLTKCHRFCTVCPTQGHTGAVHAVVVASVERRVYSGSLDNTIRVWSSTDGTHLQTMEGHTGAVLTLALGADDTLISGSADSNVRCCGCVCGGGGGGYPTSIHLLNMPSCAHVHTYTHTHTHTAHRSIYNLTNSPTHRTPIPTLACSLGRYACGHEAQGRV